MTTPIPARLERTFTASDLMRVGTMPKCKREDPAMCLFYWLISETLEAAGLTFSELGVYDQYVHLTVEHQAEVYSMSNRLINEVNAYDDRYFLHPGRLVINFKRHNIYYVPDKKVKVTLP